jgi:hypothetical protein
VGAWGRGVAFEPDAQQTRNLQTTEIVQQQKDAVGPVTGYYKDSAGAGAGSRSRTTSSTAPTS